MSLKSDHKKLNYLIFMVLFKFELTHCQIINNFQFEAFKKYDPNLSDDPNNFNYLYNWQNISWQCFYCNSTLPKDKNQWYYSRCDFDKISPYSANGMAKLIYEENCSNFASDPNYSGPYGCTGYIYQKLSSNLEIGSVYDISFWVYIMPNDSMESELPNHIGFTLSNKYLHNTPNNMLDVKHYSSMNLKVGQWCKLRYFIKPQCELNYLTIGLFRDKYFPQKHRNNSVYYFNYYIDDVEIKPIKEDNLSEQIIVTPHCRVIAEDQEQYTGKEFIKQLVYFNSGVDSLNSNNKQVLDTLFNGIKNFRSKVYKIIGHTDTIGFENCDLSKARAESVTQFLITRFKLSETNFITHGNCSNAPVASNKNEKSRKLNRRVEIIESDLPISTNLYRLALQYDNDNNEPRAKEYLTKWLVFAPKKEWIVILFDPRFKHINKTIHKNYYVKIIKEKYLKKYGNLNAYILDSFYFEDQRYRSLAEYLHGVNGLVRGLDSVHFPTLEPPDSICHFHDQICYNNWRKMFDPYKIPTISEVGSRSAMTYGLMLNHARDTALIAKQLETILTLCKIGEFDFTLYAYLADIYLLEQKKPQMYGTQFYFYSKKADSKIYKDHLPIHDINENRKKIGLNSIELN